MYTKRTISSLLVLASILSLVACGGSEGGNSDTSSTESTTAQPSETTALTADIPDDRYEGHEFTILANELFNIATGDDIFAEEETGDAINDAVYRRNALVEERFGIKIVKEEGVVQDLLGSTVLAGDDAYDIALPNLYAVKGLASNGYITPIEELTYIAPEKPWWNSGIYDSSEIAGKHYFLIGDSTFGWKDAIWAICFNKRMIEENKLENPYELVTSGKWTFDVLKQHSLAVTRDLNGDSVSDYKDQWGLLGSKTAGIALITSSNVITVESKGDEFSFNLGSERNINVLSAIRELMTTDNMLLRAEDITGASDIWTEIINVFREGRALYRISIMRDITGLRDMEDDFGIIPLPKYDESGDYVNTVQAWSAPAYVVPRSNQNLDRTSAILEYMASVSPDTISKAYNDVTLRGKVVRDNDSEAMLELIFDNMFTDIGLAFEFNNMRGFLVGIINSESDTVASTIDANKSAFEEQFDSFLEEIAG